MAHFAQLDENNVVIYITPIHNNELVASKQTTVNEDGTISASVIESEDKGIEFCKSLFGADTKWVQTSYNGNFRGKYAGIGDTYDAVNNVFISPVVESIEVATPVVEPVQVVEDTQMVDIPVLTTTDLQTISSTDIPALNTSDISSLG